jgi:hypothetical protein
MMRKQMGVWLVGLVALALLVTACGKTQAPAKAPDGKDLTKNKAGYTDITAEQLAAMMENKDLTLVNVHIPYAGDIPQTGLSIPFDQIEQNLDQLPDKEAEIVLYCRSGRDTGQVGLHQCL